MKIHFGLILFFISSSLFASSEAERENRQIEETEEKRVKSVEVETLNFQLQILSLLEKNNEVIKEISNGLKDVTKQVTQNTKEISNGQKENTKEITKQVTKVIKEISNGLKENTNEMKKITKQAIENTKVINHIYNELNGFSKQVSNTEFIKDFTSEINDNTNRIKENTDEITKISINIKDITNGIGENNEKEKKIITEITNNIKQDINGIKKIVNDVAKSTGYLEEIKTYFIPAKNCDDLRQRGDENSGIQIVHPYQESPEKSIKVLCDQQTEGGGWTVFQVRENLPKREYFQRNWKNYSHGFGNLNDEFWMGLELINVMTKLDVMELRVDLEDDTGEKRFAKYESFSVEDEDEKFKLNIGSYSGTAGNSLSYHNQRMFSTMDRDNDSSSENCAISRKGAWWYGGCHFSNLNGFPHVGNFSSPIADGIIWYHFRGGRNSMVKTKMMFRISRKIV